MACCSLGDVFSDFASMVEAFLFGRVGVAAAILVTMVVSICVQMLVVVMRHRHRGRRPLARELLICLSFFKPVVDLVRQLRGDEVEGAPFDLASERAACKIAETTCEHIGFSRGTRGTHIGYSRGTRSTRIGYSRGTRSTRIRVLAGYSE